VGAGSSRRCSGMTRRRGCAGGSVGCAGSRGGDRSAS